MSNAHDRLKASESASGAAVPASALPSLPPAGDGRILVVGDVMLDRYWFGEVERISPEAPVPVVKIGRMEDRPGGAANVARNVAALGSRCALLSVVGDDEAGTTLGGLMKGMSVESSLHVDPAISTTVKLRVIGRQQQLLRIDFETAPSHEVLQAKLAEFELRLAASDAVILSDYGKGGLKHIERMIELARHNRKPVLVDPKGDEYARYRGATVITPNRAELREVAGRWKSEDDLTARAHKLLADLDITALLLTRSEEGMTLYRKGERLHVPTVAREVYDVSGAGDTVIAVFSAAVAAEGDWKDAAMLANAAAGIVVGKVGTATASPAEILANYQEQEAV
jgi:rfaE bifunctional protein kinase chain/domain